FFSSRRRHTRWPRDWSSDVCSSDLKIDLRSRRIGDGRTVSAGGHTPTKAESFIRGATLRTRGRAGRSAEDRLLCKQEALGSNPSRSIPLRFKPNSARGTNSVPTLVEFPALVELALMRWRRHRA